MCTVLTENEVPPAIIAAPERKLRVALFTDSDVFAGTERHILDLACVLRERGVSVQIACPTPSSLAARAKRAGLPVTAIRKGGMIDIQAIGTLRKLMAAGELDLVHAHNGRTALSSSLAAALAGTGVCVHTQHLLEPGGLRRNRAQQALNTFAQRWTSSHISHFIAMSAAVRDAMIARGGVTSENITVVPNGISTPAPGSIDPPGEVRAQFGINDGAPLIVCVARLEPEKDIASLVAAMSGVAARDPAARCIVVGEGSQRPAIARQILKAGLTKVITLAGFRTDYLSVANAADVFVLPSLAEPFGLVILEAMALGKPVIATAVGAPLDIVLNGKTGLLVPPSSPAAMAAAILQLLADPVARASMGAHGLNRFEECFTAARMSSEVLMIYKQALAARKPI